ncbi:MAG TPA: hypothetical protein VGI47_07435 [Candidatus Binataceae bacterium]
MGKVIQFRQLRVVSKPDAKRKQQTPAPARVCSKCPHKLSVHITHPNGVINCSARGCNCETHPSGLMSQ